MSRTLAIALFAMLAVVPTAKADGISGDELARRWNEAYYYTGKTAKSRVSMRIASGGSTLRRQFVMTRINDGNSGNQKYFVYFQRPSDVRRMTLLVWKKALANDDRWLYLPALDLVKRIEGKQGRTAFAGSDFLYEDISGRPVSADKHKVEKSTDKHYVLLSVPKHPDSVEFDAYRVFVDKGTFLPLKAVFYKRGKKIRDIEMAEVETIDGHPTVTKAVAHDFVKNSKTTITMSKVQFDLHLPGNLFTEASLRNAPSVAKR